MPPTTTGTSSLALGNTTREVFTKGIYRPLAVGATGTNESSFRLHLQAHCHLTVPRRVSPHQHSRHEVKDDGFVDQRELHRTQPQWLRDLETQPHNIPSHLRLTSSDALLAVMSQPITLTTMSSAVPGVMYVAHMMEIGGKLGSNLDRSTMEAHPATRVERHRRKDLLQGQKLLSCRSSGLACGNWSRAEEDQATPARTLPPSRKARRGSIRHAEKAPKRHRNSHPPESLCISCAVSHRPREPREVTSMSAPPRETLRRDCRPRSAMSLSGSKLV